MEIDIFNKKKKEKNYCRYVRMFHITIVMKKSY